MLSNSPVTQSFAKYKLKACHVHVNRRQLHGLHGQWKMEDRNRDVCTEGFLREKQNIYHKVSCHIEDLTGLRGLASFDTSRQSCQETTGSTFSLCSLKKCSTEMNSFIAVDKISIDSSHEIVAFQSESATKGHISLRRIWLGRNSKKSKGLASQHLKTSDKRSVEEQKTVIFYCR